jgi:hypothetical protein
VTDLPEVAGIFELHLRPIGHSSPVNTKYRSFEAVVADLLGVRASDVYASHIAKAGNFDVRMRQSDRVQGAKIRIGLIPAEVFNDFDLDYLKARAVRLARDRYPGSSVLLICDGPGGWTPVWAVEEAGQEARPGSFTRLIGVIRDFYMETYPARLPESGNRATATLTEQEERLVRAMLSRPETTRALYDLEPTLFARLIESDVSARDVIAINHRRSIVDRFRELLQDPELFRDTAEAVGSREAVWQRLLEENPWILGVSLAGQLLTSWNEEKLEQVVAGFSIAGPGKRADALLRTNGGIRAMVFAEIKHHETALLSEEYRGGCWSPSPELSGGVVQVQRTVQLAIRQIGDRLPEEDEDGVETGEYTYMVRPRQFLIAGNLAEFRGARGINRQKYESFELFRRNIYEPEILTFDELLARAEWHVEAADREIDSRLWYRQSTIALTG